MKVTKVLFVLGCLLLLMGTNWAESRPVAVNPTSDTQTLACPGGGTLANDNLQTMINCLNGGPGVDALTGQLSNQLFSRTAIGNSDITLAFKTSAAANANGFGIYDATHQVVLLPGGSTPGDAVVIHFNPTLAHPNGYFTQTIGNVSTNIDLPAGFNAFGFGLFLQDGDTMLFSQDALNPGALAQMLTYRISGGTELLFAFEDISRTAGSDGDFNDAVLVGESLIPVPEPASLATFGAGLVGLAGLLRRRLKKQ